MARGTPESIFVSSNHQIFRQHDIKIVFFLDDSCFFTQSHIFSSDRFTRRTTWLGSNHLSASSTVRAWFLIHRRAWDPVFPTRASEDSTSDIIHIRFPPTGLANHTTIHTCLQRDSRDLQGLTENFDRDTGKVRMIGLLAEMKKLHLFNPNCWTVLFWTQAASPIVQELFFFFDGVNGFGLLKRLTVLLDSTC